MGSGGGEKRGHRYYSSSRFRVPRELPEVLPHDAESSPRAHSLAILI